jgi:hypothetical protein
MRITRRTSTQEKAKSRAASPIIPNNKHRICLFRITATVITPSTICEMQVKHSQPQIQDASDELITRVLLGDIVVEDQEQHQHGDEHQRTPPASKISKNNINEEEENTDTSSHHDAVLSRLDDTAATSASPVLSDSDKSATTNIMGILSKEEEGPIIDKNCILLVESLEEYQSPSTVAMDMLIQQKMDSEQKLDSNTPDVSNHIVDENEKDNKNEHDCTARAKDEGKAQLVEAVRAQTRLRPVIGTERTINKGSRNNTKASACLPIAPHDPSTASATIEDDRISSFSSMHFDDSNIQNAFQDRTDDDGGDASDAVDVANVSATWDPFNVIPIAMEKTIRRSDMYWSRRREE